MFLSWSCCVEITHKGTGGRNPRKVIYNPQTEMQIVTGENNSVPTKHD